jgi:hypothetical protein
MNGVRGRGKVVRLGSEEDDEDEVELEEGQEIKGRIYPAPKKGQGECDEYVAREQDEERFHA